MNHRRKTAVAPGFADRLTELARALHLTTAQLIRQTELRRSTVYVWINGTRVPDIGNPDLATLARRTSARLDWLTEGTGPMFQGRRNG